MAYNVWYNVKNASTIIQNEYTLLVTPLLQSTVRGCFFMPMGLLAESVVLDGFLSTITGALGDFTTENLGVILVAALGLTAGLAICWFGYRFIVRKVSGALKKGKL